MARVHNLKVSFFNKVFLFTLLIGLIPGCLFPFLASTIIGPAALTPSFFLLCLLMGAGVAVSLFFFLRRILKKMLHHQLEKLKPLAGSLSGPSDTMEDLQDAVDASVLRTETLVNGIFETVEQFFPHTGTLAEGIRYLRDRAREGLAAARTTWEDIRAMEEKQKDVMEQVQNLSHRAQDEAALSRELSASLEEMAGAMEHSTSQFLETTTSMDELAQSVREVARQADEVSRSVEGTAQDLDAIGESLEKIRRGSQNGSNAADAVKKDAENGLTVVKTSMEEMDRIEQESHRTREAMERLSQQTGEVVKIIEVIKELVSDTELLAFNAAIIAAKAGEDGKGFSVVAEEIRDLADRTTSSAQDIHRIIKAIGADTGEVMEAVDSMSMRIAKGKQLSLSTGEALRKIVESSSESASASEEIAILTGEQGEKARSLLDEAGQSLRSIKAIARAIQEQQSAIDRIQEGVTQMKGAADQVARGMEEQVRANHGFDQGLNAREEQIGVIQNATHFQMETAQKVFKHFAKSESRLATNAEKSEGLMSEIRTLENLAKKLRSHIDRTENLRSGSEEPAAKIGSPLKAN